MKPTDCPRLHACSRHKCYFCKYQARSTMNDQALWLLFVRQQLLDYVNMNTEVFLHPVVSTDGGQSTMNAFEEGWLYWWVARKDSGFQRSNVLENRKGKVEELRHRRDLASSQDTSVNYITFLFFFFKAVRNWERMKLRFD